MTDTKPKAEGLEAGHDLPDADPAQRPRPKTEVPDDTTCEASGTVAKDSPVPEEQRHPYSCPVCGALVELTKKDEIPEHDDLRLVPEEPDDWRGEAEASLAKATKV